MFSLPDLNLTAKLYISVKHKNIYFASYLFYLFFTHSNRGFLSYSFFIPAIHIYTIILPSGLSTGKARTMA